MVAGHKKAAKQHGRGSLVHVPHSATNILCSDSQPELESRLEAPATLEFGCPGVILVDPSALDDKFVANSVSDQINLHTHWKESRGLFATAF